jgi:hypothetical protein
MTNLQLHCSKCGVSVEAACNCGVPYIPAGEAAAVALETYPTLSSRAIGEKTGISYQTIRRARKSTDTFVSVEKRVGLDGKERRMPRKPETVEPTSEQPTPPAAAVIPEVDSVSTPTRRELRLDKQKTKLDAQREALTEEKKKFEERRASFEQIVKDEVWRLARIQQSVISAGGAPFSPQQFMLLLSVCHPDSRLSVSEAKLREAYDLLIKNRLRLEYRPMPTSVPPLKTLAEIEELLK